jgi:CheY-like chemotaxis protein
MKLGVLSDIEMPEMDGIELLKTIRRDLNLKDIPVIILTTLSDDEHITQTMNEGVMAYIIKTEITPASLRLKFKHHQTATVGHL